jgi:amino acid adenylation domain-containing protein
LLAGAVADPRRRLSDLPLLTTAEAGQITAWCRGAEAVCGARLLHEAVAAWADLSPEAPAVIAGGETLGYGELDARSNRLARRLRSLGVGPEVRVALSLPRSAPGIVGVLAILKSGGVYVPVDPAYPVERRLWMLEDSGARVLVTLAALRADLPASAELAVLSLDAEWDEITSESAAPLAGWADPRNLAYVIYTSGSTGRPKGVGVEHGAAAGHLQTVAEAYVLSRGERTLQMASWSFDVSIEQILAPLAAGATVVLWEGDLDARELLRRSAELGVTFLDLPPAFLQLWAREAAGRDAPALPMRAVLVGGEALSPEVARLWPATPLRKARLLNGYGPTEAVIGATLGEVAIGATLASVPIGGPLRGRSAHVLDRHGNPVPPGVPGELCLGGVLARGYLGRPEATAERFVPDPFAGVAGERLYRTGDRVRWLPAGDLEFLGRIDQQVKVRGFRIEPGEIEAALAAHAAVAQAAVVVVGEEERRLVAFLVAKEGEAVPGSTELRVWLARTLPDYMIPSVFVGIPALPLTPSAKVDRRALAGMAPEREVREAYAAPASPLEESLAGIWAAVLRVDRIGTRDNFFDLGGHSLLATQLLSRVRETFGVELPLRTFFEQPTVAAMARAVAESRLAQADAGELERLFADLEGLSEEEAEALLAGEGGERLEGGR